MDNPRKLELLAPAANKEVAMEAVLHGADAVYIGGPSHGARKKASNSVEDIVETVAFAHTYGAKVYVTLNTLVYDSEIPAVEKLVRRLYEARVDALIVQDMALLRMDIPPIALHASTQCDNRTPEKALFLEKAGMSQIVLARELSLSQIKAIAQTVSVPLECFVHGALCVSYSGRCAASQSCLGRSANRGECAQMCRMPYDLRNGRGELIEKEKYLLSLRDLNASASVEEMALAGVSSFKIEGRLKEKEYVKNVTANYRKILDEVISKYPGKFLRSSFGKSEVAFKPDLQKSFNRSFTSYFLHDPSRGMASLKTPKSMGEPVDDISSLNPGDGISFFNNSGEYVGVGINKILDGKIIANRPFRLPMGAPVYRTLDIDWQRRLAKPTAVRTMWVDMEIDESGLTARDERGMEVRLPLGFVPVPAAKPMNPEAVFAKLGNTCYRLRKFVNNLSPNAFVPISVLTSLRRQAVEALLKAGEATWKFEYRRKEDRHFPYPESRIDARGNVANAKALQFYEDHGVKEVEPAVEVGGKSAPMEVMTTRYCLRRELGACLKDPRVSHSVRNKFAPPLSIQTGPHKFDLEFNCRDCEMKVIKKNQK